MKERKKDRNRRKDGKIEKAGTLSLKLTRWYRLREMFAVLLNVYRFWRAREIIFIGKQLDLITKS